MDLIIKEYQLPSTLEFNYDEIKNVLEKKCKEMASVVYTDDTIKDAKKDRAELNRFKKELNDKRIALEKEYMKPFGEFKAKINELIGIVDEPVAIIDARVKDYEAQQKELKKETVRSIFAEIWETEIPYEMVEDIRWYNASTSVESIRSEIEQKNESIKYDLETIKTLSHPMEAELFYKKTLDIRRAIEKSNELDAYERMKKAAEEKAKEEVKVEVKEEVKEEAKPVEEKTFDVVFEVTLTASQARALKDFFNANGIPFRKVER